jgi:hypothetical protein
MTVTKSPITEESPKETVKTIAQGMPDRFGLPVVTLLVCFFCFAREAAGDRSPGIPCALYFRGDDVLQNSGAKSVAGLETCDPNQEN